MFKTFTKFVYLLVLVSAYSQAGAWTAVAHSKDSGYSHIAYNSASEARAKEKALEACSKVARECVIVGNAEAGPGAMVVAIGAGGMSRSFNKDAAKAAQSAKQLCAESYKNCRVVSAAWDQGPTWASVAIGKEALFVVYDYSTKESAESLAIEKCEQRTSESRSCQILRSFDVEGWISIVSSKSHTGVGIRPSRNAAVDVAKIECAKGSKQGDECLAVEEFKNSGGEPEPAAFKKILAQIEAGQTPTKKKVNTVRYTDSCSNADCIRKYSDGRSVRYVACLNPATLLPMNDPVKMGGCGGTDSRGNPFGLKSM